MIPDVITDLEGNVVPWARPVDLRVVDLHRRDGLNEVGGVTTNVDLVTQGERSIQADRGNRAMAVVVGSSEDLGPSGPALRGIKAGSRWPFD